MSRIEVPSGVSINAIDLLSQTKKSDLEAKAKKMTLTLQDLDSLIINCENLGYTHKNITSYNTPKHLQRKAEKPKSINDLAVIRQLFKERKILINHIFSKAEKWHIFSFDNRDQETLNNHWKNTHCHFCNYLWPGLDYNEIIHNLERGKRPKGIHISTNFE